MTVRQQPLVGSVGVHDPEGTVGLEGVVIERGFILEAILAAVPHDVLAVAAPDRVCVSRGIRGQALQIAAVGPDGEDIEMGGTQDQPIEID